jgi:metal-sulfur cluster biosynthetic enzyme
MKEFVSELPDVERVFPKMVFSPPWTPDLMSEEAKFALGF